MNTRNITSVDVVCVCRLTLQGFSLLQVLLWYVMPFKVVTSVPHLLRSIILKNSRLNLITLVALQKISVIL